MTRLTTAIYNRLRAHQLIGRRVRFARRVIHGHLILPRGLKGKIFGKRKGIDITTDACVTCGVSLCIRQLDPTALVLLPETGDVV